MEDSPMKTFGGIYKLRNLIKEPTCFKNLENPISYCQASRLTSKKHVIETWLSDFHKIIVAVMTMHFPKMKPQVVSYRKYQDFYNKMY